MTDFFRFPHTPHITWLGEGSPRGDKELSTQDVSTLLSSTVIVEEKLDGANIGISIKSEDKLQIQNRGQYLLEPYKGQFSRLQSWLGQHQYAIKNHLKNEWILFGEWCAARHSLHYPDLPDWFLLFDVYDRKSKSFWSVERRNQLAAKIGIVTVPQLYQGKITVLALIELLTGSDSCYRDGVPEGVIIRKDAGLVCEMRAKLVGREFIQAIDKHWRNRVIEWNRLSSATGN